MVAWCGSVTGRRVAHELRLDRRGVRLMLLVLAVALDGRQREDQGQRAEEEGLDEVEDDLEREQPQRDERDRESGHHAQRDLTAIDVAEEAHRQGHGLDQLQQELDEPDEDRDEPRTDALPELAEWEELPEVAEAQVLEALELEIEERDQREPDGDVDVARRRTQDLDLADGRDEAAPVREQDQQEEPDEQRDVRPG